MKLFFAFLLMLFFTCPIFCQNKLWIGTNAAVNYDHFKLNDPGGQLSDKPVIAGLIGINLEKELSKIMTLGTGIYFKTFMEKTKFKNTTFSSADRAFNSVQIPFYLKAGKFLNNGFFKLNGMAGVSMVINADYSESYPNTWSYGGGFFFPTGSSRILDTSEGNANLRRFFQLFHAGGGIAFSIFKKCKLELNVIRHFGLTEVIRVDIDYLVNGSEYPHAKLSSKGSYTATSLQFFYPLNQRKNKDSN